MMTSKKPTFAERLNIGSEVRELKLGHTFSSKNTTTAFHTLKYDFKPKSVDRTKKADAEFSIYNQVTITVPNMESSGVAQTVYKGNHKEYTKECILIIDKKTGEITLERLCENIQVKKTRCEKTNAAPQLIPNMKRVTKMVPAKANVVTGVRRRGRPPKAKTIQPTEQTCQVKIKPQPQRKSQQKISEPQHDHNQNFTVVEKSKPDYGARGIQSQPEPMICSNEALEWGFGRGNNQESESSGSDSSCESDSSSTSGSETSSESGSSSGTDSSSCDSESDSDDENTLCPMHMQREQANFKSVQSISPVIDSLHNDLQLSESDSSDDNL